MRLGLLLLMVLAACAPKRPVNTEETWRDFDSKLEVRLDVVETLLDQGALRKAETIMAQMRAEGDDEPELDYLHGRSLYLQGMYAEAEELLVTSSAKMKKDPRPQATLGLLYADTKRPQLAVQALKTSLEHDENNAKSWNNLGFVLTADRRYDEAVEALRAAVRLDGTVGRYRNNLGYALHASGQPADALQVFKTTGSAADAHAHMALAWELAGSTDQALEQYTAALESNPNHTTAKEGLERLEAAQESP